MKHQKSRVFRRICYKTVNRWRI